MYQPSSQEFWAHFFTGFLCSRCGSDLGYASRPRNFFERFVIPVFFLKTVRCGECYRRTYRPLNLKVRPRRDSPVVDHQRAVTPLLEPTRKEPRKQMPDVPHDRQRIA
jgi:hypothetical protein